MKRRLLILATCACLLFGCVAASGNAEALRIQFEDRGPQVTQVQQRLQQLGFYSSTIDGVFGYRTYLAVKGFQSSKGLYVDGIIGPDTMNALNGVSTQTAAPKPTAMPSGVRLKYGDVNTSVLQVQLRLKELGYFGGSTDGKYGYYTYTRVNQFQANNGLKADGVVGPLTWTKLFGADAITAEGKIYPVYTSPSGWVKYGDTGGQVLQLQTRLNALGYAAGAVDGEFGYVTYLAVRAYQRDAKLKVDGIVGPSTWEALFPG